MNNWKLIIGISLVMAVSSFGFSVNADSLWKKSSSSPYSPEKSFKVGDIITVLINEISSAQHKAGTKTDIKDDLGLKFTHSIDRLTPLIGTNNTAAGQWSNKYGGSGGTERSSNVTARVAALVTEVMDNGNMRIEGKHKVNVNDENQEIVISGIVRSKDISVNNTINSYQVANAEVAISGTGVVQEAESPGWLTRILNWLF
ncbi:flagellar basal body L-ring protein FlgH [Candidatus Saganbacteria bacterium]|nr:flagellar basal body L-ring protein FlgH [Candidatus Saganbacteria bacterium]